MKNVRVRFQKAINELANNAALVLCICFYWTVLQLVAPSLFSLVMDNPILTAVLPFALVAAASVPFIWILLKKRRWLKLTGGVHWQQIGGSPLDCAILYGNTPIRLTLMVKPGHDVENATVSIKHPRGVSIRLVYEIDGCSSESSEELFIIRMVRGASTVWDFFMEVEAIIENLSVEFELIFDYRVGRDRKRRFCKEKVAFVRMSRQVLGT